MSSWLDCVSDWVLSLDSYSAGIIGENPSNQDLMFCKTTMISVRSSIEKMKKNPYTVPKESTTSIATIADLMNNLDDMDRITSDVAIVSNIILDPKLRSIANSGMSKSYSESTSEKINHIVSAKSKTYESRDVLINALNDFGKSLASIDLDGLSEMFRKKSTNEQMSTSLYISILMGHSSDPRALKYLNDSARYALGILPDNEELIMDSFDHLEKYHITQSMSYRPIALSVPELTSSGSPLPHNLIFPNTRDSVVYNISPLINIREATKYGPMTYMGVTGLTEELVTRLRTMTIDPIDHRGPSPERQKYIPTSDSGDLLFSTDGGKNSRHFIDLPPSINQNKYWAPFAGINPLAEAYQRTSEVIILNGIKADREIGWDTQLRKRYEQAVRNMDVYTEVACSADDITLAIVSEFIRVYDETPPSNTKEFREILVGNGPSTTNIITSGLMTVGRRRLLTRLRSSPGSSLAPKELINKEATITQFLQTIDAGQTLWKYVRDSFRNDPSAFGKDEQIKRSMLIKLVGRIVRDALSKAPVICSTATIKFYGMSQTAGSVRK